MTTFCPATMCPHFAAAGSPWTGALNAACEHGACGWWNKDGAYCNAGSEGVAELRSTPGLVVLNNIPACPRATTCQWQRDANPGLCPPRLAIAKGLDPRIVAF